MRIKVRKKLLYIIGFIVLLLIGGAVFWFADPAHQEDSATNMRPGWDIADNVLHTTNNRNFAQFLVNQDLDPLLHEDGPYTVFVPSDKAYNNVPSEAKAELAKNDAILRSVLLFHIVEGKHMFSDLKDGMELTTVQGEKIKVKKEGQNISLNGYSYIETYDIPSSNGVIHVVTNYLIPGSLLQQ